MSLAGITLGSGITLGDVALVQIYNAALPDSVISALYSQYQSRFVY